MAYVFNDINQQLSGQQKSDIFGQAAGGQQVQQQGGQQNAGGAVPMGGSGGSSGGSAVASTSSGQGTQKNAATGYKPQQAQAAYAGIGPVDTSKQTGKIKSDIATANSKLQDQANTYMAGAQQKANTYGSSAETIEKAASGDQDAYKDVTAQLQGNGTVANQYEAFKGLENKDLPTSADPLKAPSTFGEIFRENTDPNYTMGESRMNAMLLRQDPRFRDQAIKLAGQQERLSKANQDAITDNTANARELISNAASGAADKTKSQLQTMSDEIMANIKAQSDAENAARAALESGQLSPQEYQAAVARIKETLANAAPGSSQARSLKYLDNAGNFDISKFINIDRETDPLEYVTQNDADRFNRINSLLGSGNTLTASATGPGSQYSIDKGGMDAYLLQEMQNLRGKEDQGLRKQLAAMTEQAQGRQASDLSYLNSIYGDGWLGDNAAGYANSMYNALKSMEAKYITGKNLSAAETARIQDAIKGAVLNQYMTNASGAYGSPTQDWTNRLSSSEAQKFNDIYSQLGDATSYKGAANSFDSSALDAAYQKILAASNIANPQVAPTTPKVSTGGTTSTKNKSKLPTNVR